MPASERVSDEGAESPSLRGGRARARDRWLLGVAAAAVGVSLAARVVHRGSYIAGWDIIAPTQGYFLASTRSLLDVLREVLYQNRHYWLPFSLYSAPFSLIPGYLCRLWPSEYWVYPLVLLSFLGTLLLILRAADLPFREGAVVLLGWGASPLLLSLSVVGYPWASGFLPHALALWITMNPRVRRRWLLTLAGVLVANEVSWHVYEVGKTAALVFLVAAIVQREVPKLTRAIWALGGAFQLYDVLFWHRTANMQAFAVQRGGAGSSSIPLDLATLARGAGHLAESVVGLRLDLPVLVILGLTSLLWLRRDRLLLLAMFATQLGLVFLLAMGQSETQDQLTPRRTMTVACYALVCVACAYRDAEPARRRLIVSVLLVGNLWQAIELVRFIRTPLPATRYVYTLPSLETRDAVGSVFVPETDWFRDLRARAEAGERLLLLYNLDCYPENYTNPAGVLERLYLSLGHERFVRSIITFGSQACRYSCLPIRPLAEFGKFLDGIRQGGETPPATLAVYYDQTCTDFGSGKEASVMLAIMQQRFRTTRTSPPDSPFLRFTIDGPEGGHL